MSFISNLPPEASLNNHDWLVDQLIKLNEDPTKTTSLWDKFLYAAIWGRSFESYHLSHSLIEHFKNEKNNHPLLKELETVQKLLAIRLKEIKKSPYAINTATMGLHGNISKQIEAIFHSHPEWEKYSFIDPPLLRLKGWSAQASKQGISFKIYNDWQLQKNKKPPPHSKQDGPFIFVLPSYAFLCQLKESDLRPIHKYIFCDGNASYLNSVFQTLQSHLANKKITFEMDESETKVLSLALQGKDFPTFYRAIKDISHNYLRRLPIDWAPATFRYINNERWFEPIELQNNPSQIPPQPDPFKSFLNRQAKAPDPERTPFIIKKRPLHIAHVLSQVVDGGHAPSRLLRGLMRYHDRQTFKPSLWITESHCLHIEEIPQSPFFSPSSLERASQSIALMEEYDVPVFLFDKHKSFQDKAKKISQRLKTERVDILVCHGHDPILYQLPRLTDIPLKVYVEHSGLPIYPGYDLAFCSVEGTAQTKSEKYRDWNLTLIDNPYGVDPRDGWTAKPPDLKLPKEIKILTTISNHLETRLNPDFVETVAAILTICPNTVYLPIGPVKDSQKLLDRFKPYKVENRVKFLGAIENPSNLCRSMHLYLNEFPFGGGLSIADAMAAGLPIVSMHDPDGPMQAQNGAAWFGRDWVLEKGSKKDFIELACKLLTNDEIYKCWSEHAINQYESKGPKNFTQRFETGLLSSISSFSNS